MRCCLQVAVLSWVACGAAVGTPSAMVWHTSLTTNPLKIMNRIIRYTYPRSANLFANRNPWNGLESEVERLFESALADFAAIKATRA